MASNVIQVAVTTGDGVEGISAERGEIKASERGSKVTRDAGLRRTGSVCWQVLEGESELAYCSRGAQATTQLSLSPSDQEDP